MFIQTQETPNPKAVKFYLEQKIGILFPITVTKDQVHKSHLAKLLFDGINFIIRKR